MVYPLHQIHHISYHAIYTEAFSHLLPLSPFHPSLTTNTEAHTTLSDNLSYSHSLSELLSQLTFFHWAEVRVSSRKKQRGLFTEVVWKLGLSTKIPAPNLRTHMHTHTMMLLML